MPSFQITVALDDKDIEDMQAAMAAMPLSEFQGVEAFQNAVKQSGLGTWLAAHIEVAKALRGAP